MKLGDIKGPIADQVNKKLLDKYNEILKGFASQLDPTKYYQFPTSFTGHYGSRGLFYHNKDIKQFIVDGGEFDCRWYRKETPEKIKELVSIFNLKGKYWVIENGFTFDNSLFSCTMEITIYNPERRIDNTIAYSAEIKVKTKDSKQLLKELSGCLGNTLPGYSKLKDGKGVDIRNIFSWQVKAGNIDPFPMFGSNIRPLGLDENTMESRLDYLLEEINEEENPRLRKRSKELYLDIIKRYDMMNDKIRRY